MSFEILRARIINIRRIIRAIYALISLTAYEREQCLHLLCYDRVKNQP